MTDRIRARATINMAGVRAGDVVLVDPKQPDIADLLAASFLVAENGEGERRGGAGGQPALAVVEDVEEDSPPEAA